MKKINKNLTAIEQKFQSLKANHSLHQQSTSIGQVSQIITHGVVRQVQVQNYIKQIQNSQQKQHQNEINRNWYDMNFQEIILFLDKVIIFKNITEPKQSFTKQKLGLIHKNKKLSQTHQNPYIPTKILISHKQKQTLEGEREKIKSSQHQNQVGIPGQIPIKQIKAQNQLNHTQYQQFNSQDSQQIQNQELQTNQNRNGGELNVKKSKITNYVNLELSDNFRQLPVQERYSILSKKYGKDKSILEKKFDLIYKHYRKEMYIPYESFQMNNELLMDLRIFLKYYREFEITKNFKTNEALIHFKKIALNGLWLDQKNFIDVHYKLIELLDIDELSFKQQMKIDQPTNLEKINSIKKTFSKNIKLLQQNLVKLNELTEMVTDEKVKSILNDKSGKKIINKIVEAHSGLTKQDVLLKLNERVEKRKHKKNILLGSLNQQKNYQSSPLKMINLSPSKHHDNAKNFNQIPLFKQLELSNLKRRELNLSSIYSCLQSLNTEKEKAWLNYLIKDEEYDKERYLQDYFMKEKALNRIPRSNSLRKLPSKMSTDNFIIKTHKIIKSVDKPSLFQRNLSLPRIKFS